MQLNSLLSRVADLPDKPASVRLPEYITQEQIQYAADVSLLQVFTALMIHASFVIAVFAVAAFAFNWRKTGFVFFMLFGVTVYLVPQGYCAYYGAIAFAIAIAGLVFEWGRGRPKTAALPQPVTG